VYYIQLIYCPSYDGDRLDLADWTASSKKLVVYGKFFANNHGY